MKSFDTNVPIMATAIPIPDNSPNPYGHPSPPSAPAAVNQSQFNEGGAREFLSTYPYSWPIGLQDTLINSLSKFPIHFFICDDSGSV